jgi:hypothetical protein
MCTLCERDELRLALTLSNAVTVYVVQQSAAVNGTAVAQWCAAHNRTVVDTLFMSDVPCDRSA